MTLGLALNNAVSGMNAGQAGLAVASQNVANANTEGYSRKTQNQSADIIGGVPNGVSLDLVTRLTNDFLNKELGNTTSDYQKAHATNEFYQLMQNLFGSPGSNSSLADDYAEYRSALEALANNPENAALRFTLVSKATTLAGTINNMANEIQNLRFEAEKEIKASVDRLNTLLVQVENLNTEISRASAAGTSTADLQDQRDLAVRKIAQEIDINTFIASDGKMSVSTKAGIVLIDDRRKEIDYSPAATATSSTVFGAMTVYSLDADENRSSTGLELVTSGVSSSVTSQIASGRIAGILEARDSNLPDLASQLDSLTNMLRDETNKIHSLGSGFPPPNSLTGTRTVALADAFQATGTVRIAVTDGSGTIVDVQDLDLTALGATTVNGVISSINTALSGNATAAISNGNLVITADSSSNGIAINAAGTAETVTSENFSKYFGLNDLFIGTGANTLDVRSDIKTDPSRVATGQLSTTAAVSEVGLTVGDNRNIQNLAQMGNTAAASIIGLSAARANEAEDLDAHRELLFENISGRYTSSTGVNLDEELANMILFQNAYSVSARIVSIASEMLDILVNIAGR
jgi:flagellar hook-associated protein 1 FlgK